LDWIAEQRIQEALRKGEFDAIPGAGAPLVLNLDPAVNRLSFFGEGHGQSLWYSFFASPTA
jgi:hypothetical protein